MSQGLSFRASATLVVMAYAVIAGVLVAAVGHDLGRAAPNYAPQVSWLMQETTTVRMAALRAAGRPETAALYAYVSALSWAMITALAAGGFAWGVITKGETVLGVAKALNYLTALAVLYALATTTELLMHALPLAASAGGIHAIPALWFATMIPSAAILARIAALIAHDAGSLITIALEGDPGRIAALVERSEEKRGVDSLEAKLARLIATRRQRA